MGLKSDQGFGWRSRGSVEFPGNEALGSLNPRAWRTSQGRLLCLGKTAMGGFFFQGLSKQSSQKSINSVNSPPLTNSINKAGLGRVVLMGVAMHLLHFLHGMIPDIVYVLHGAIVGKMI